jgi:ribosomal protein L11 methyltransferase
MPLMPPGERGLSLFEPWAKRKGGTLVSVEESFWWYVTLEGRDGDGEVLESLVDLSGSIGAEHQEGTDRCRVRAFYRSSQDVAFWLKRVNEVLEPWPRISVVDVGKVENQRWHVAWQESFPPLEVGKTLVVMAPWHRGAEPPGRRPLYIYPGSAFGTGYHETTQIMLELMESTPLEGKAVADIGTGSGILAIAAARLGARSVVARDLDPAVMPEIQENCRLNAVPPEVVTAEVGDLLKDFRHRVDLVVATILLEPLLTMLPHLREALLPGGRAIFSGMVQKERERFLEALREHRFDVQEERSRGEWWGVAVAPEAGSEPSGA